jgi:hypothetical protein
MLRTFLELKMDLRSTGPRQTTLITHGPQGRLCPARSAKTSPTKSQKFTQPAFSDAIMLAVDDHAEGMTIMAVIGCLELAKIAVFDIHSSEGQ